MSAPELRHPWQEFGGPAFPVKADEVEFKGMCLRDYFAAKALAAMIANPDKEGVNKGAGGLKWLPVFAYEWADAMLKARQS